MNNEQISHYILQDGGEFKCSRYGRYTHEVLPMALATLRILQGESGEPITAEDIDHTMFLIVNNHDDVEYMVREYGEEYGYTYDELLP